MEDLSLDLSPITEKKLVHLSKINGALQPGDHIAVPILQSCEEANRPWHHGIYIGEEDDDYWVIHMNGHDKASAIICRDSLDKSFAGKQVISLSYNTRIDTEVILRLKQHRVLSILLLVNCAT